MEDIIKVAIIGPSRIILYREKIQKQLSEIPILFCSRYYSLIDLVKDNPHLVFHVTSPNFFFDRNEKANDLAREIKAINSKNKLFSYSREVPAERDLIDIVTTDLKSEEDEINNLISLLS